MNALEFRNVSVWYEAHRIPTLKEWVMRTVHGRRSGHTFRALRNVSFELGHGAALGIIGPNGAGKSTLLRVAAAVITPNEGESITRGTVAPIIELGTGFDAELSGRENILFNGALLGRSRLQMTSRVDEIIDFAGLRDFIDQPVRTYSTGMVARLAFAVATTVDADVILLDEILSVGDMAFRERCEERIQSFARRGATMVLVSHDLESIRRLCSDAMWIDGGQIRAHGPVDDVLRKYEQHVHRSTAALASAGVSAVR